MRRSNHQVVTTEEAEDGAGRVAIATVISAREWEPDLAQTIRTGGLARLVVRAYDPDDIVRWIDDIDVIVVGAETPWVSPWLVAAWRRLGLRVIGVHPAQDRHSRRLLQSGGADDVLPESIGAGDLIAAARAAALH